MILTNVKWICFPWNKPDSVKIIADKVDGNESIAQKLSDSEQTSEE